MRTTGKRVRPATRTKISAHSAKLGSGARGEAKRSTAKPNTTVRINSHGAEQALRDSELRYRRLFESAQDGILILDAKTGAIDDVNPYLIDMLGYSRAEFLDKKLWEVGAFKNIKASKETFRKLQKEKYVRYDDLPLKANDGRVVPVEFVSNVYLVGTKKVIQCNIREITGRKQGQEELRATNEQLQALLENVPEYIYFKDTRSRFLRISASHARAFGLKDPREAVGKTDFDFFTKEHARDAFADEQEILRTGRSISREEQETWPDRPPTWVLSAKMPFRDEAGRILGTLGISTDITERKRAEESLRESEDKLRALFAGMTDVVIVYDADGRYLEIAPTKGIDLFRPASEMLGQTVTELYPPDQAGVILDHIRQVLKTGQPTIVDYSLRLREDVRWFSAAVSPLSPSSVIWVAHDITARKRAEDALKNSDTRFRSLIESGLDNISLLAADGALLWESPAVVRTLGYRPDEFVGHNVLELVHPDDLGRIRALLRKLIQEPGSRKSGSMRLRHSGGAWRWVEATATNLLNEPTVNAIVLNYRDITERKRADEALAQQHNLLRTLIDNVPDAIYAKDTEGRFVLGNVAVARVMGAATPEDLVGKTDQDFFPKELAAEYYSAEQKVIRSGQAVINREELIIHPDGSRGHVLTTQVPLRDRDGSVVGLVGIGRDITERRQAEIERQTLLEIMQGMTVTEDLRQYLTLVHHAIAKVIYAENFFVILKNKGTGLFEEVYSVDKYDPAAPPSSLENSISAHVFRSGEPLLLTQARFDEMAARGEVQLVGANSRSWLGVPLITSRETIGVMAVQDYETDGRYSKREQEFMVSIAAQVAAIVERRRAEEALRESEGKLRSLFAAMTDVVIVYDADGRYLEIAPTKGSGLFRAASDFLGKTVAESFAPDEARFILDEIGRSLKIGELRDVEYSLRFGDQVRWFSAAVSPLSSNSVIWVAHDITQRRQAEEQIRSRTDELSKLYELSRALANAGDLDKALEVINRQAVETVHVTFARVALLEGSELVVRAAYPVRVLDQDLSVGKRAPLMDLPSCQRALATHEAVILHGSDPEIGSQERATLLLDFAHTLCLVPLSVGSDRHGPGTALGLLMLGEVRSDEREPFTPDKVRLASSIGDQAATAARRILLSDETGRRLGHLAALHTIDLAISGSFDLHMVLQVVLEQVTAQLGADAASCMMLSPHTQTLEYAGGRGFRTGAIERSRLLLGEGLAGRAALERRTQIADLPEAGSAFARAGLLKDEGFVTYIGVPLIAKGQVKGVLDVFQRRHFGPDPEWLDFLEALAGQAAIAIDSASLFENLQRSNVDLGLAYDATIAGWSRALDLRDKETEGHTQRVTEMSLRLARLLGLRDEELVHLRRGGLLHDIGKMGVPDGILLKPGPLTDEEWVVMRKHPVFAYEMLSPIRYLHAALDVPYCHHEKWDGTGYPRGLKGEQIPLVARIFAVIDVWDALISDRPYRKAWTSEKALEYIRSQAGTHFDSQVVQVFLKSDLLRRSQDQVS